MRRGRGHQVPAGRRGVAAAGEGDVEEESCRGGKAHLGWIVLIRSPALAADVATDCGEGGVEVQLGPAKSRVHDLPRPQYRHIALVEERRQGRDEEKRRESSAERRQHGRR